jgi:hypothetical protein
MEEKFPKRRVRGKQKQLKQVIPAEDVLRTMEEAANIVADAAQGEGEKRVQAVSAMANQITGEQQRKIDTLEHNTRATVQAGGSLINKIQRKADKQTKRAVRAVVAERARTIKAKEQVREALSFAETVAQHVNGGEAPRRRQIGPLTHRSGRRFGALHPPQGVVDLDE